MYTLLLYTCALCVVGCLVARACMARAARHRPAIQLSKQHHCGLRKKACGVGAAPLKAREEMNLLVSTKDALTTSYH